MEVYKQTEIDTFRSRLPIERVMRGITQSELAHAIGVTQPHLSYIESGKRNLSVQRYVKIKEYFDEHPIEEV